MTCLDPCRVDSFEPLNSGARRLRCPIIASQPAVSPQSLSIKPQGTKRDMNRLLWATAAAALFSQFAPWAPSSARSRGAWEMLRDRRRQGAACLLRRSCASGQGGTRHAAGAVVAASHPPYRRKQKSWFGFDVGNFSARAPASRPRRSNSAATDTGATRQKEDVAAAEWTASPPV